MITTVEKDQLKGTFKKEKKTILRQSCKDCSVDYLEL